MLNRTIGEWILSTVTTPQRAAAIVGDLLESDASSIRFWSAIGSNVLHAVTPRILLAAIVGLFAQFFFSLIPLIAVSYSPVFPFNLWYWCFVLTFLATQLLTGLWIGRASQRHPLLVCLLVVAFDCALGLRNFDMLSINMAIWSIPLMAGTIAAHRKHLGASFSQQI